MAVDFNWVRDIKFWAREAQDAEFCEFSLQDFRSRSGIHPRHDWTAAWQRWAGLQKQQFSACYSIAPDGTSLGIEFVKITRQPVNSTTALVDRSRIVGLAKAASGILAEIESRLLTMHSEGLRPRRILVPHDREQELRTALLRSLRGRIEGEASSHILGIPWSVEGDELRIEIVASQRLY